MILVWGVPKDGPTAAVLEALERRGAPVFFLDQHQVLDSQAQLSVDGELRGSVRTPAGEVRFEEITAAYIRPYETGRLPALSAAEPDAVRRAEAFDQTLLAWCELTHAHVVNRPSAMASNNSKPYQSALIRAQGFAVPETIITTDPAALEAFWSRHRRVIYKSMSGVRSIVRELTPEHRARFADLGTCPTQFQQWIPGSDFRVHVAGEETFGCEIVSSASDYRYPGSDEESPEIRPSALPGDLAARCRRLAESLGLALSGIDLRRTPEGEWYCFEVNPSPGFTYYEAAAGQPISAAVAALLSTPAGAASTGTQCATRDQRL